MWDSLTPQPAPTGMDALDKLIEGQAPQLITDPGLLHDYARSTPYWIDDKSHSSARESPYRGMY